MGLADEVINAKRTDPAGKTRYIYKDSALHALPNSALKIMQKFKPINRSLLSVLWQEMRAPPTPKEYRGNDESIHGFISRRFSVEVRINN